MECPCKYCEHRGCGSHHDQCDVYQQYRQEIENSADRKNKNKAYMEYRREGVTRMIKKVNLRQK